MIFPGSDRVPDPGKFPVPTGFDPYYIKKIGKLKITIHHIFYTKVNFYYLFVTFLVLPDQDLGQVSDSTGSGFTTLVDTKKEDIRFSDERLEKKCSGSVPPFNGSGFSYFCGGY